MSLGLGFFGRQSKMKLENKRNLFGAYSFLGIVFAMLDSYTLNLGRWAFVAVFLIYGIGWWSILFLWISPAESKESEGYQWNDQELGIYFKAQPKDPVWGAVTEQKAEAIQKGFIEAARRANLDKYTDTNSLPSEVIDTICDIANEIGEKNDLKPIFVILLAHQYVDADPTIRLSHKSRWIAWMVSRWNSAPPPEAYMKYIKSTYFSGDE